ncbi:MAG: hypothetical protein WA691_10005 [Thermoplasmata archaeon]
MNERTVGRPAQSHRVNSRKGMMPLTAAVVLVAAIGIAGAVGFVVLSEIGVTHTSTSSTHSCTPPTAPQCQQGQTTVGASSHPLTVSGGVL